MIEVGSNDMQEAYNRNATMAFERQREKFLTHKTGRDIRVRTKQEMRRFLGNDPMFSSHVSLNVRLVRLYDTAG